MEQRKRESLIPKGTFELEAPLEDADRGDVSGTFLRPVSDVAPSPVARIALKRQIVPPPPPPAGALKSLRPTPPKRPSLLPPLPPRVPTTTPQAGTLRALVAPSYPPPASVTEQVERIDFQDFALRLDVAPIAPAPSSLLPLPNEERPKTLRAVVLMLALVGVGAAGWLSRGLFATTATSTHAERVVTERTVVAAAPMSAVAPSVAVEKPVDAEPAAIAEPASVPEPAAIAEPAAPSAVAVVSAPIAAATSVATTSITSNASPASKARSASATSPMRAADVPTVQVEATPVPAASETPVAEASGDTSIASVPAAVEAEPLPETLEREEVVEGIELLRNEYQACAGDMHGTAEIRITIASTGRITHALVGGDFAGTPQGSCLARTLRQARFRSFLQPRLDIVYPIAL